MAKKKDFESINTGERIRCHRTGHREEGAAGNGKPDGTDPR